MKVVISGYFFPISVSQYLIYNTTWNINGLQYYFLDEWIQNKYIPRTQGLFNNGKSVNVFHHINW